MQLDDSLIESLDSHQSHSVRVTSFHVDCEEGDIEHITWTDAVRRDVINSSYTSHAPTAAAAAAAHGSIVAAAGRRT